MTKNPFAFFVKYLYSDLFNWLEQRVGINMFYNNKGKHYGESWKPLIESQYAIISEAIFHCTY